MFSDLKIDDVVASLSGSVGHIEAHFSCLEASVMCLDEVSQRSNRTNHLNQGSEKAKWN